MSGSLFNIAINRAQLGAIAWIIASSALLASCNGDAGRDAGGNGEKQPLENPDGDSLSSSYLIESVTGFPTGLSNESNFTVTIKKRNGSSTLQWKLSAYSKSECAKERGWSAKTSDEYLTIAAGDMPDGDVVACVRAFTEDGLNDSNYMMFRWKSDRTVPEAAIDAVFTTPVPPATQQITRTVALQWVICEDPDGPNGEDPTGLTMHRVQVGTTEGGKDVLTSELGVLEYQTAITLPRDGRFYFSIACPDLAGNEVVTKLPYPLDIDTSAPSAPTSISWNRSSPTNQANGIVLSWSAVSDDTPVTYLYRLASNLGGGSTFTSVLTNSVTLNLSDGTYYATVKAVNAAGLESTVYAGPTPLVVDTVAPGFGFNGLPNQDSETQLSMGISSSASDIAYYQYKILRGAITQNQCHTIGTWSEWTSTGIAISEKIKGPAYQTTISICARAKDTAGNETPVTPTTDETVLLSWNNAPVSGASAAQDDFNLMFTWAAAGSVKAMKTSTNTSPPRAFVWPTSAQTLLAAAAETSYSYPDITLRNGTPFITAAKTSGANSSIAGLPYGGVEQAVASTTSAATAQSVTYNPVPTTPVTWVFYGVGSTLSSIFNAGSWNANSIETLAGGVGGDYPRVRSVTAPDGTVYSAWDQPVGSSQRRSIAVRRIPQSGDPETYVLASGFGGILDWCDPTDGKAYLLDMAVTSDSHLNLLISCVSTIGGYQKVRIQRGPFDTIPQNGWPTAEILRTGTLTPPVKGSLAYNSSGQELVAFTHPGQKSAIYVCYNPLDTGTNENCPSSVIEGSANTLSLSSFLGSDQNGDAQARILTAGELSGLVRIGIAEGTAGVSYDLRWLHAEDSTVNKNNFSLAPRLIQLP